MNRSLVAAAAAAVVLGAPAAARASFAPESVFGVGNDPYGVSTADFNGDGRTDLAVVSGTASTLTVFLRLPAGGFAQEGLPIAVGEGPTNAAVADFNGDGRPDIAVANFVSSDVTVLLRQAGGGFVQEGAAIRLAGRLHSIVAADFTRDGRPDLAVTRFDTSQVTTLWRMAAGGFSRQEDYSIGLEPGPMAVSDFNRDGVPDLAITNAGSDNVTSELRGASGVGFAPEPPEIPVGDRPLGIAADDFNGDGRADLAVSNYNSDTVTILLRPAAGRFEPAPRSPLAVPDGPVGLATGDFNGDGRRDLAVASNNAGSVTVELGNGAGDFAPDAGSPMPLARAHDLAVADFNADGRPDLAVSSDIEEDKLSVLLNTTPLAPVVPVVADRDRDGVADGADNCPDAANPTQADGDGDRIGDACELLPSGSTPAVAGVNVVARALSGDVRVKLPSGRDFVPLAGVASLPVGSVVDASKGELTIQAASNGVRSGRGRRVGTATLAAGIFQIKQARARGRKEVATDLVLTTPPGLARACASSRTRPVKGVVRTLSARVKGVFRTVGAASATTARDAAWTTSDRCDGTLTKVSRGRVKVGAGRRTITLRAGRQYLAKARLFGAMKRRSA